MNIISMTPHTIVLHTPDGESLEVQPSGEVVRVEMAEQTAGDIFGIPAIQRSASGVTELGECFCIPDPVFGCEGGCDAAKICTGPCDAIYVVSSMALSHYAGRA